MVNTDKSMKNKIHRITGYITKAEIFSPFEQWGSEKRINRIFLEPFDPMIYEELELEAMVRERSAVKPYENPDLDNPLRSGTELFVGTSIKFQTVNRPRLTGRFQDAETDDALYHQVATVVSSMVTLKDGNSLMNIIAIDEASWSNCESGLEETATTHELEFRC